MCSNSSVYFLLCAVVRRKGSVSVVWVYCLLSPARSRRTGDWRSFAESGAYPPDTALPGSPRQRSLPLACRHPPEVHEIGARKGLTPGNTILSEPYRRHVSTDRPNREGSQLAAPLEGGPGPTPAGKTLPNSYPGNRFRRESAQNVGDAFGTG